MQKFKEIPHQNYIELRFHNKIVNQLNEEEAMLNYKRNSAILGKIFSFNKDSKQVERNQQHNIPQQPTVTPEMVQKYQADLQRQQQIAKQRSEQGKQRAHLFQQIIESSQKIKTQQQLTAILQRLKDNDLYDHTHPFLNQNSPFYLNSTQSQMLPVENKTHFSGSHFSEQGMSFEEIV